MTIVDSTVTKKEGQENLVSLINDTIVINFSSMFGRKLEHYHNFKIVKRSYLKKLSSLYLDIEEVINNKELGADYAFSILSFKYEINKEGGDEPTIEYVINFIKEHIFSDKNLISIIDDKVDNNYELDLDSSVNLKNENLQITDELNRKYLKSSMLMRLLLPIISAISDKITKDSELDRYILEMFTECMIFMNDGNDEILKKIFNIVSSRIIQTRYSDRDIWEFLKSQNIDITITIREFNNYIITNNFLKIMNNKSIISYIDVVLKNKLRYRFKWDYKVSHKTVDYTAINNDPDNSLTEIDKLEATLLRKDKGLAFINLQSIYQRVKKIINSKDFDSNLYNEYKKILTLTDLNKNLLDIFYSREFDIVCDNDVKIILLYNMLMVLEQKGFVLLPQLILSHNDSLRTHNKRIIREKLSDSIKYKLLLKIYEDVKNLVNKDNNFINDIIVTIKQGKFINSITGQEVILEIEKLNEEILDFLYLVKIL